MVINNLEIRLLGPPEVLYSGQPVKFAARKALALFIYLVVEPGTHPREKLETIFWPESEARQARSSLRTTLLRIKDALKGLEEPLRMDGDRVAFNASSASFLDLEFVTRAVTDTQPIHQIAPTTLALLQNAVEATRGPFLEAFSLPDTPAFNDWIIIQRNIFGGRLNLIYDRLSNHQLETHLIHPAIETVNRWLVLDRLNESAYQRLMRLYFLNGERSAALQVYETCRELLDKEVGVEPSSETEEVLAYIRSSETPASVSENQAEAREEAFHIPFVGRSNEYQSLVQTFHLAQKGKPQVAVVSGESGMGKTRLADEFLKWAGTQGADVLRGRAYETSGLPYQPIIDALRERLERENAPEDLLDDVWLMELTRILPELRERYPDLQKASGDEATARSRLFEAIARLGASLSARSPLILLMDDLQWADVGTLELLHYLARSWRVSHNRILLLILIREESHAHQTGLRDWMSGLTRDLPVTRLSLRPVQASDIREMVQALTGENVEGVADLSAWLIAETNGQPFFVVETLSALDDYGALVWVSQESAAPVLDPLGTLDNLKSIDPRLLTPTIHDVILSRLEWLSQSASAVLSAAAVIGRNCNFELLGSVAGTDEQNSLDALDELLSARLISETRNESRPYNVSHDRIREVVYGQISAARREVFHRRALTALTESKAPSAELAHHALSAKEWGFAFQHSLNAGDEAMRLYEVTTAVGHYEISRTLLNKNNSVADAESCLRLYTQLGLAYELEFHHRKAVTVYEEMQVQASIHESQKMELAALVVLCKILPLPYDSQNLEKAVALAMQAHSLAQTLEDMKAQAQIELSLARTHKFGDKQIESTLQHLRAAEGWARKAGVRDELGVVLLDLGVALLFFGQLAQARSTLTESMEIFRELNQSPRVLSCLHNLAIIQLEMGKFDSVLTLMEEAYKANKVLGSPTYIYSLAVTHNVVHILRGQYGPALETLLSSLEMDEFQIVSGIRVDIFQQMAWCYYDLGAYDAGLEYCQRAVSHHDQTSQTGYSPAYTILALLHIRRGNLTEADAAVKRGWENFDLQWQTYAGWPETLSILQAEAELALAQGELDRAARCVHQLLGKYEELKLQHFKPSVLYLQARVQLAAGNKKDAYQTLCDALALSDEMGAYRQVWEMCWALSHLETERGNESVAVQLRERACYEALRIAEHAGTPELRKVFLSRPDVQLIVGNRLFK
jgi:DNA-binding SARP family transcriptional activator